MIKNIFDIVKIPANSDEELFESIYNDRNLLIERIISTGQVTPDGIWLEEDYDEWVILLQGNSKIKFDDGKTVEVEKGDYFMIPSNTKHKVILTSKIPCCIWLAIHIKQK
jgi:cupin 2 domain-containing protein